MTPRGFTLIELLIAMAIVGILASIAYPSYQEHVTKSRRRDAEGALQGFANAMERHFTETNSYLGAGGTAETPADTGAPRIYATQSPVEGGEAFYELTINDATATTYILSAAPTGAQDGNACGTLTLTNTGARGITGAATGLTVADCW